MLLKKDIPGEHTWRHFPDFKTYCNAIVIKTIVMV